MTYLNSVTCPVHMFVMSTLCSNSIRSLTTTTTTTTTLRRRNTRLLRHRDTRLWRRQQPRCVVATLARLLLIMLKTTQYFVGAQYIRSIVTACLDIPLKSCVQMLTRLSAEFAGRTDISRCSLRRRSPALLSPSSTSFSSKSNVGKRNTVL